MFHWRYLDKVISRSYLQLGWHCSSVPSMLGRYCKGLAGGVESVSGSCGLLSLLLLVSQECSSLSETIGLRNGHFSGSLVVGDTPPLT